MMFGYSKKTLYIERPKESEKLCFSSPASPASPAPYLPISASGASVASLDNDTFTLTCHQYLTPNT
ncbi:MAG: hypothetical protein F6K31_05915 [Symploca sp. SIO2G7]|nr:hypothetical protein [Symploca sp. SIO2G7]